MPADLRRHVRSSGNDLQRRSRTFTAFSGESCDDPDTFYNRSDAWDVAKFTNEQGAMRLDPSRRPTSWQLCPYGETQPEFLLDGSPLHRPKPRQSHRTSMMARCEDGAHLGEKIVLLLSKQEIIYGPIQVEARINQDQNISKDLTLWNQQGSQVLRGQMLAFADRAYVPVCRAHLTSQALAGQNAAAEEGSRSRDGQQSGLRRYLPGGARAARRRELARARSCHHAAAYYVPARDHYRGPIFGSAAASTPRISRLKFAAVTCSAYPGDPNGFAKRGSSQNAASDAGDWRRSKL